jgi:hypothetical protein
MGWVKYLSPNEGMIQTATLSLDSSRPQTWIAALTIAPVTRMVESRKEK